jgi:hypothetical protein
MTTAITNSDGFRLCRRFGLCVLVVLVLIVAMLAAWQADRLRRRAQAVALLRQWDLSVSDEALAFSGRFWSLLPDWSHQWLSPWRSRYLLVETYPLVCGTSSLMESPDSETESWCKPTNRIPANPTPAERKLLVAAIATLTELQHVQLSLELDDEDLRSLSSLSDLESLTFKTRRLTGAGVAHLQKLRKLEALVLDFDSPDCLPVETVAELNELPCLQRLFVNGPMSPEDVSRVKAILPRVTMEGTAAGD